MVETLDIGCGVHPHGNVNLDIEKSSRASNFVRGDAHNLPFKNKTFHKIICHHTLEHLENPSSAIKEMARVTNGEIEIIVPWRTCEKFHNRLLPWRQKWAEKHHKHFFTKKQLETILKHLRLRGYVQYRYRLGRILRNFKRFPSSLKQFLFYELIGTFLPPLPELKAQIICRSKNNKINTKRTGFKTHLQNASQKFIFTLALTLF